MSRYFPFRSDKGDRKYSAEDWAAYFALFLSNGIFYSSANKMKVVENDGMTLTVVKGAGFINGRMFIMDTDFKVTLDTADGVLNRIDRIVLRCNYTDRKIEIVTIKGSYSENPIPPDITRNADAYDLVLADVYVGAGVIVITAANITDQRLNTSLCGIVTAMIDQADTTEIFSQFQTYLQEFKQTSQDEFYAWFNEVKNILSDDVAGNLLLKIEEIPIIEVSNSNVITEEGIALDARQANPSIEGTLAYKVKNQILTFQNKIGYAGTCYESGVLEDFPYQISVTCEGVDVNYVPYVTFDVKDAIAGIFAPVATTASNIIYIYSNEKITENINIPVVQCIRKVADV